MISRKIEPKYSGISKEEIEAAAALGVDVTDFVQLSAWFVSAFMYDFRADGRKRILLLEFVNYTSNLIRYCKDMKNQEISQKAGILINKDKERGNNFLEKAVYALLVFRAYPSRPVALHVIMPHARCSMAM